MQKPLPSWSSTPDSWSDCHRTGIQKPPVPSPERAGNCSVLRFASDALSSTHDPATFRKRWLSQLDDKYLHSQFICFAYFLTYVALFTFLFHIRLKIRNKIESIPCQGPSQAFVSTCVKTDMLILNFTGKCYEPRMAKVTRKENQAGDGRLSTPLMGGVSLHEVSSPGPVGQKREAMTDLQ